jgi:hypothetical protein
MSLKRRIPLKRGGVNIDLYIAGAMFGMHALDLPYAWTPHLVTLVAAVHLRKVDLRKLTPLPVQEGATTELSAAEDDRRPVRVRRALEEMLLQQAQKNEQDPFLHVWYAQASFASFSSQFDEELFFESPWPGDSARKLNIFNSK